MELTENQLYFFRLASIHPEIIQAVHDFWAVYDRLRERGELPEITDNPHVDTGLFKVVGYVFSVRTGLAEVQSDLPGVIEKLSNGTVKSPWML